VAEDLWISISALQHYAFCPRQCALIYLDGSWEDNLFTLRGHRAHEKVDVPEGMIREGIRIEKALPLWSERLGLVGKADVVEFIKGVPYPVEHKVGPRKYRFADEIQLCAQAMCLEEMFSLEIAEGALYYRKSRRRAQVTFSPSLRENAETIILKVRSLFYQENLPPPADDARCKHCSLADICMPHADRAIKEVKIDSHTP